MDFMRCLSDSSQECHYQFIVSFELSGFQEPVFRHQSNSLTDSTLFSYSPILTNSPLFSFLQSDSHYMRKGLTPSTLHSCYFTWRAPAFFCLTVSTPLCPIFIVTVYAFICHCKDVKNVNLPYIWSLIAGIQLNDRSHNTMFVSLFPIILLNSCLKV